jgi:tRNA(Ser,Leu) C12 N-acetylase TAN1
VRLKGPDKLVHIDILGRAVAISVLRQDEIFSVYAPPS